VAPPKPICEDGGRLLGQFGGRAIDDDGDQVAVLRKCLIEDSLVLAPRQVGAE